MGGGGGGGFIKSVFEASFPRLWKKNTGTFFDTKDGWLLNQAICGAFCIPVSVASESYQNRILFIMPSHSSHVIVIL